jgi:hypothetical protein
MFLSVPPRFGRGASGFQFLAHQFKFMYMSGTIGFYHSILAGYLVHIVTVIFLPLPLNSHQPQERSRTFWRGVLSEERAIIDHTV